MNIFHSSLASKPRAFRMIGQSNLVGNAPNDDLAVDLFYNNPNIQIFNILAGVYQPLHIDSETKLGNNNGIPGASPIDIHGVEMRLAKLLYNHHNTAYRIHKYGLGNTYLADIGFDNWFPTKPNNLFLNSQESWTYANRRQIVKPDFVLWWQGENDSLDEEAIASYNENEMDLINADRVFFNDPTLPYVIVGLSSFQTGFPDGDQINDQKILTAAALENVVYLAQNESDMADIYHLGAIGIENVAQMIFDEVKDYKQR